MKNNIFRLLLIAILVVLPTTLTSCGDDEPNEPETPESSQNTLSKRAQEIYNKLSNTTWTLISSPYPNSPLGNTIPFTSIPVIDGAYKLYCSAYPNDVFAWLPAPDDGGDLLMTPNLTVCDAGNGGAFAVLFGSRVYVSWSGNRMTLTSISNSSMKYVYTQDSLNPDHEEENGNEKPDVGFYDYTQLSTSSVKVDFVIYNKEEAGVSSASIKYGTNSSATSSVSTSLIGNHAIATIDGLKSNTKYYVKCTVKGKGGTITTDAITISLTSW